MKIINPNVAVIVIKIANGIRSFWSNFLLILRIINKILMKKKLTKKKLPFAINQI